MKDWKTMLFSAQGRIRRSQYWLWTIASVLAISFVIGIFSMVLGGDLAHKENSSPLFLLVYLLLMGLMVWIGLCLQIKRWHDRDKSGWWVLIGLIPIIGGIWAFIEVGCLDGTQGPNKFGPSPKGIGAPEKVF